VRLTLFNDRHLLDGENAAEYDELVARMHEAIKPFDVIYEMLIADLVYLQWDVLRWRRVKWGLMRLCTLRALKDFLAKQLDYDLYQDQFRDRVMEILQDNLAEDETENLQILATECARNEPDAVDKVNELLARIRSEQGFSFLAQEGLDMDAINAFAQARKAEELVEEYVRGEQEAITVINRLLARAGVTMDSVAVETIVKGLDNIERIEQLMTDAESRRNAALREIDRRHAILGQALRRTVQEIEHDQSEVIEGAPSKGKDAA
jgi:hypothetical protein